MVHATATEHLYLFRPACIRSFAKTWQFVILCRQSALCRRTCLHRRAARLRRMMSCRYVMESLHQSARRRALLSSTWNRLPMRRPRLLPGGALSSQAQALGHHHLTFKLLYSSYFAVLPVSHPFFPTFRMVMPANVVDNTLPAQGLISRIVKVRRICFMILRVLDRFSSRANQGRANSQN